MAHKMGLGLLQVVQVGLEGRLVEECQATSLNNLRVFLISTLACSIKAIAFT